MTVDGTRPDFTFFLPNNLALNMDVKFPLDNYMAYIAAEADADRKKYRDTFLRDVRSRVSEILKRGYISDETVDCVLVFIPNEQIYRFILEEDDKVIDDCLRDKVILCSPITLFTVLAIIRQAANNFALEKSAREVLKMMNDFKKQWELFVGQMDKVERHIRQASDAYETLIKTRSNSLEKPLKRIDSLMSQYQIEDDGEIAAVALLED